MRSCTLRGCPDRGTTQFAKPERHEASLRRRRLVRTEATAGFPACESSYSQRLPRLPQWHLLVSSSHTAAGPRRLRTNFPSRSSARHHTQLAPVRQRGQAVSQCAGARLLRPWTAGRSVLGARPWKNPQPSPPPLLQAPTTTRLGPGLGWGRLDPRGAGIGPVPNLAKQGRTPGVTPRGLGP